MTDWAGNFDTFMAGKSLPAEPSSNGSPEKEKRGEAETIECEKLVDDVIALAAGVAESRVDGMPNGIALLASFTLFIHYFNPLLHVLEKRSKGEMEWRKHALAELVKPALAEAYEKLVDGVMASSELEKKLLKVQSSLMKIVEDIENEED